MQPFKQFITAAPHKLCLALITLLFAVGFAIAPTQEAQAGNFELGAELGWHSHLQKHDGYHGFHVVIVPGYRFVDWVGLYLDQGLGGLFWRGARNFSGQTILNARFFFPVDPVELWAKVGLGGYYTAWHEYHGGAFALKFGLGVTYDIKGPIGIGVNFDYMPIFWSEGYYDYTGHILDLMVHFRYKF